MENERNTYAIRLTYGATENLNEWHGWVPSVTQNGRELLSPWSATGRSRDAALGWARDVAIAVQARYVGDWDVSIEQAPSFR